mmetsp:Transcript_31926/g.44522  ORF Transcript_31926/g.44522 Transcript_31926/m.44522 type:complete len:148 (-) Transcript_31926:355-798(-)
MQVLHQCQHAKFNVLALLPSPADPRVFSDGSECGKASAALTFLDQQQVFCSANELNTCVGFFILDPMLCDTIVIALCDERPLNSCHAVHLEASSCHLLLDVRCGDLHDLFHFSFNKIRDCSEIFHFPRASSPFISLPSMNRISDSSL